MSRTSRRPDALSRFSLLALLLATGCGGSRPGETAEEDADVRGDDEREDAGEADAMPMTDDTDGAAPSEPSDAAADACTGDCGQPQTDAASEAGAKPLDQRPPSCTGLADMCGPKQDENCCTSLLVPRGTFWLGRRAGDPDDVCDTSGGATCFANEMPAVQATVRAFRLDRFEVTVGRFRKFVEAKIPPPAAGSGKHGYLNGGNEPGWDASWPVTSGSTWERQLSTCTGYATWTTALGANENKAINCVPWADAYAFCIWDGGFLPTEAEWEYAASGGEERLYPLGASLAYACYGTSCLNVRAVGSYAADDGKWGHADLAGNVFEWVLDAYATYSARCDDCANFTFDETKRRIARGGAASQPARDERAVMRDPGRNKRSLRSPLRAPLGVTLSRAALWLNKREVTDARGFVV